MPAQYGDSASFSPGRVFLDLKYTIGAAGAPTAVAGKTKGATSLAVATPGVYTLTLANKYLDYLRFKLSWEKSSTMVTNITSYKVTSYTASTGVLIFVTEGTGDAANQVPTDPTSGFTMVISLDMLSSSAT